MPSQFSDEETNAQLLVNRIIVEVPFAAGYFTGFAYQELTELTVLRKECSSKNEFFRMAQFLLVLLIVVGMAALLLYVTGRKNPYSEMTDEEFEEQVRKGRGSLVGSVVLGLEGALRKRETAVMMEAKTRIEKDATPSPDKPSPDDAADFHLKKKAADVPGVVRQPRGHDKRMK